LNQNLDAGEPVEFGSIRNGLQWADREGFFTKEAFFRIRLHPSEEERKYSLFLSQIQAEWPSVKFELTLPGDHSLSKDCGWANIVMGIDGMALVVALDAGRRVVSSLGQMKIPLTLPQKEIIRI